MTEVFKEPVAFFLLIISIILITPLLSERVRLPGIVGIILGGMLIGPHGFKLLDAGDRMVFLSTIGLVYLMFNAGLEVDIHQFMRVRWRALVFGVFTFTFPQLMGLGLGRLIGLDWLGSLLLGSAFASHTLIAFPILAQMGMTRNQAVAITAGATVITDISAFLILAIVLGARNGQLEISYFVQLIGLLVIMTLLIVLGLPRLGKLFFQRFKSRAVDFQFVLVVLFVSALAAQTIGVHEVVGAFLAGLAINATLPRHSPVTGHVLFMGESFFIPVFLLYSGMITDPVSFLRTPQTILVALGVTFVAYVSKFLAALIVGRIFHYTRAEFWTTYGLSHAQAAVTIPTLVIGLQYGLFDNTLFNAAIIMILFTSITSPMLVQRFAPGLKLPQEKSAQPRLFERILVPITNPATQGYLLELSNLLAKAHDGMLLALNVISEENNHGKSEGLREQKELLERVVETINDPEARITVIPRLASSPAHGIIQTSLEQDASLIVMGWRGRRTLRQSIMGSVLDEVMWGSDTPVIVGKLNRPLTSMQRMMLILPAGVLAATALGRVLDVNFTLARALNVPLKILADGSYLQQLGELLEAGDRSHPYQLDRMIGTLRPHDLEGDAARELLVVPGYGSRQRFKLSLGNIPEELAASFSGNIIILHLDR